MRFSVMPQRVALRRTRRFWADSRGTMAIEFSFIMVPFLLLILGLITIGMHYFTIHSLDLGVSATARKIRTGEAQKAGQTFGDFKKMICDAAGTFIDCTKVVVHVKSGAQFADLDPPISCATNGALTPSAGVSTDPLSKSSGVASATVVVTACYKWDFGGAMWQRIWNTILVGPGSSSNIKQKSAGNTIITATTTFRTEPYN